jgi:hypothetical protein
MTITDTAHVRTVPGELFYLAPESTVLRRFTAPGNSVNTGIYRSHVMPIHDGRPIQDQFTLDRNGFEILEHRSAVADFTDSARRRRTGPWPSATTPASGRTRV